MPHILVSMRPDWTDWISAAHSITTGSTFSPSLSAMAVMISPSIPMILPPSSLQYGMSLSMPTIRTPGLTVLTAAAAPAVGAGMATVVAAAAAAVGATCATVVAAAATVVGAAATAV